MPENFTHHITHSGWGIMRAVLVFIGLLSVTLSAVSAPADYTLTVHVNRAHWFRSRSPGDGSVTVDFEILDAIIGSQHFELMASDDHSEIWLMKLGDYKAKLVEDRQKPTGETHRVYELLLPNGQARRFVVVGQSE